MDHDALAPGRRSRLAAAGLGGVPPSGRVHQSVGTVRTRGPALSIAGDPESAAGATWTLIGTLDGTTVELQGILIKPRGRGPFPAVVLSHGAGGNAQSYGRALGGVMRTWGLVSIAPNYTHARGAPPGAPGTLLQQGASPANAFRAHAAATVLARLGYVDVQRVAAHGHSMGAFVTTAFVAAYPGDVRVASHTSGGALLDAIHVDGIPAPSVAQARRIQAPYQWHHALLDYAVPFLLARRSTPSSPPPTRAISIAASVTPRSPKIARCWRGYGPGTPARDVLAGAMTPRLFVYGTLAPGRANAHVLAPVPGTWEPATVTGRLLPEGWGAAAGYPGIILDEQGGPVAGLLFTSDSLGEHWSRLDAFEGDGYRRVRTTVRRQDGTVVDAYVYALSGQ